MRKKYLTKNSFQTKKLGEMIGKKISLTSPFSPKSSEGLVIGLEGDLGGGKTTFLQGFSRGLGIKEKILSPTFIIMRKFKIQNPNSKFKFFHHIDCYRMKKPKGILDLGFKEITSDPKNIVAIEWSNRVQKILPKYSLIIKFELAGKNKRKISLKYGP